MNIVPAGILVKRSSFRIAIFIALFVALGTTRVFANRNSGPDSSSNIHYHIINNVAPFVFVNGLTLTGKLKYEFDHGQGLVQSPIPLKPNHTSYLVDYNGVGLEIGTGCRFGNIGIFISGGYQYLNYWSGKHSITRQYIDNGIVKSITEGVPTEHEYPNNVLLGSAGIEYTIRLSQTVKLAPFLKGKMRNYVQNRFYPISANEKVYYALNDNYSWGGGIAFKGVLPSNTSIGMRVGLLKHTFKPIGYFDSKKAENLFTSNTIVEFSISYEFDFSGYEVGVFNHFFGFYK